MSGDAYRADPSLKGKLRRRLVRLQHRRPAPAAPPRAMVSFSFDDAPRSAFVAGAQALEARGARGTYFVSAGTAGETGAVGRLGEGEDVARAHAAGHEIACHTFSHLDCAKADPAALSAELERNLERLQAWGVAPPTTFAYPYGEVGAAAKAMLGARFALARALHPGVLARGADLAQAPAVAVEGEAGEARALRWIEAAARRSAWLILFTHGVEDEAPPYGCTRAAFGRLLDRAEARGLEIVTVAEGARRMGGTA